MCLRVSYKPKIWEKKSHWRKELDLELEPDLDPDPFARGTDPQHWIGYSKLTVSVVFAHFHACWVAPFILVYSVVYSCSIPRPWSLRGKCTAATRARKRDPAVQTCSLLSKGRKRWAIFCKDNLTRNGIAKNYIKENPDIPLAWYIYDNKNIQNNWKSWVTYRVQYYFGLCCATRSSF
jgi:hypothetical protein